MLALLEYESMDALAHYLLVVSILNVCKCIVRGAMYHVVM